MAALPFVCRGWGTHKVPSSWQRSPTVPSVILDLPLCASIACPLSDLRSLCPMLTHVLTFVDVVSECRAMKLANLVLLSAAEPRRVRGKGVSRRTSA